MNELNKQSITTTRQLTLADSRQRLVLATMRRLTPPKIICNLYTFSLTGRTSAIYFFLFLFFLFLFVLFLLFLFIILLFDYY